MRWDRGVDTARFDPALRGTRLLEPRRHQRPLLRADHPREGRRPARRGVPAGARAGAAPAPRARRRRPRAGALAERLGAHATFLGWLSGAELARAYANADLFLFPSATDTFGQVILEAQASGLPVVAVAEGGPLSLIEDRVTGLLLRGLRAGARRCACSSSPPRRCCARASRGPRSPRVRERTWERALARLGEGYGRVVAAEVGDAGVDTADAADLSAQAA